MDIKVSLNFRKSPDSVFYQVLATNIKATFTQSDLVAEIAEIDKNYENGFISANEMNHQIVDAATHYFGNLHIVWE